MGQSRAMEIDDLVKTVLPALLGRADEILASLAV